MKMNELMFGDWVYINGKMTKIGGLSCESSVSTMRPIKITTDVMKMFGFKIRPVNTSIFIHKSYGKKRLMIEFYDGKVTVFIFTFGFDELRKKVRYIHELQHVMRLMEIKKELDLKEDY